MGGTTLFGRGRGLETWLPMVTSESESILSHQERVLGKG